MAHTYAQIADVQAEFKSVTFGATSTPTSTAVDDMIDEEEAEVDASVGMKYSLPIGTGTRAYKLLRKLTKKLVCGRIKNIITVKSGSTDANQGKVSDGDAQIADAKATLKRIRDGEVNLVTLGAVLASTNDGVRSFNVDNEGSSADLDDVDDVSDPFGTVQGSAADSIPVFQRGKKMW